MNIMPLAVSVIINYTSRWDVVMSLYHLLTKSEGDMLETADGWFMVGWLVCFMFVEQTLLQHTLTECEET